MFYSSLISFSTNLLAELEVSCLITQVGDQCQLPATVLSQDTGRVGEPHPPNPPQPIAGEALER